MTSTDRVNNVAGFNRMEQANAPESPYTKQRLDSSARTLPMAGRYPLRPRQAKSERPLIPQAHQGWRLPTGCCLLRCGGDGRLAVCQNRSTGRYLK
jgi:hypothetical protein